MIYPPPIRLPYRLLQIGDKVLRVFEADRKAQQALVDSQLFEHRLGNRAMSLHKRIRYEALRAAKALREEASRTRSSIASARSCVSTLKETIAPKPDACRQDSP